MSRGNRLGWDDVSCDLRPCESFTEEQKRHQSVFFTVGISPLESLWVWLYQIRSASHTERLVAFMIPVVSEKGLSSPPSDYKGETPSKSAAKTKTRACKRLIKMAGMYLPVRRKPTTKAVGLDRGRNKQIRDRRMDGREPAEVSGTAPAWSFSRRKEGLQKILHRLKVTINTKDWIIDRGNKKKRREEEPLHPFNKKKKVCVQTWYKRVESIGNLVKNANANQFWK